MVTQDSTMGVLSVDLHKEVPLKSSAGGCSWVCDPLLPIADPDVKRKNCSQATSKVTHTWYLLENRAMTHRLLKLLLTLHLHSTYFEIVHHFCSVVSHGENGGFTFVFLFKHAKNSSCSFLPTCTVGQCRVTCLLHKYRK